MSSDRPIKTPPDTMQALCYHRYGDPQDVLSLQRIAVPKPKGGEVLLQVEACSMNASDYEFLRGSPFYARMFGLFKPRRHVLGSDIAGRVLAIGEGVKGFKPGDAVYGDCLESCGGFAEYAVVKASSLMPKPKAISFVEAAALPQSGAIAMQAMQKAKLQPGAKILIVGAAGGGGSFATQLAKREAYEVTAVDRADKLAFLTQLGADQVMDYQESDLSSLTPGYDLVLDLVGGGNLRTFHRLLAKGGRYYIVGGPLRKIFATLIWGSLWSLISSRKLRLLAINPNQGVEQLAEMIADQQLGIAIDRYYTLQQSQEAFEYFASGAYLGKVVIGRGGA